MQRTSVFVWASVAVLLVVAGADADTYDLNAGSLITLPATGADQVVVENSSVIRVESSEDNSQLIVRGIGNGTSDLRVTYRDGRSISHSFRVTGAPGSKGAASAVDVQQMLRNVKGIAVYQAGAKVIIDGNILSADDGARIDKIAKEVYPGGVIVLANTDHQVMKPKDNIVLEFHLVEIRKKRDGEYGIKWAELLSGFNLNAVGNLVYGAAEGSSTVHLQEPTGNLTVTANIDGFLKFIATSGFGKIHDTHKIVTLNGQTAKYLVGGELGFRVVTRDTASVLYKEYGAKIAATPVADDAGNIQVKLESDVTALAGVTEEGVPNLTKNSIYSVVQIKEGQTIAMSGMISKVGSEEVERLPGLGHIPGLGALFSSKAYQKGDSEGVVFITAKRILAGDGESSEMIRKPVIRFDKIDEKWWKRQ